ncbi:MAG: hypothetical protein ACQEQD_07885 [Bacillota bacterium]
MTKIKNNTNFFILFTLFFALFIGFNLIANEILDTSYLLAKNPEYVLEKSSLPENWEVKKTIIVPENYLDKFSKKLNGEIISLYNYLIDCEEDDLWVNPITASSEEEAKNIYDTMLVNKTEDYLYHNKNLVVEFVGFENAKKAKQVLKFVKKETKNPLTTEEGKYLKDNSQKLYFAGSQLKGLDLLSDSISGKKLFITAESHGVEINQKLEFEFLKYFKEKADINYYLQETSFSASMLLNKYLKTGNEDILKQVFNPLEGTFAWTKEKYNLWKNLYRFNQSLPKKQRIIVLGFDIEHQLENAFWYLNTIIPEKEAPQEIKPYILKIKSIYQNEAYNNREIKNFVYELKDNIDKNQKIYEDFFGQDFFGLQLINDNLINRYIAYKKRNEEWNITRDKMMYDNFLKIYSRYSDGKYYGQWGLNHAFQEKQDGVNWFAAKLDNDVDSPLKGQILSIVYLYQNCTRINNNGEYSETSMSNNISKQIDLLSQGEMTLFKLNGRQSPFSKDLIWMLGETKPKKGVTTDYFQYLIFLEDYKASTPLRN